jgi:hypothetical protein
MSPAARVESLLALLSFNQSRSDRVFFMYSLFLLYPYLFYYCVTDFFAQGRIELLQLQIAVIVTE